MTNLPITPSTAQTAAVSKQPANNADTGNAQNAQPFGEVLARQINDPNARDAKMDIKVAADVLAQLGTDTKIDKKDPVKLTTADNIPADNMTTLPTDMLAAMLPQVMNVTPANTATVTSAKSEDPLVSSGSIPDKRGNLSVKSDITTSIQPNLTQKISAGTIAAPQIKEQPFAAALNESANRTPTGKEQPLVAALNESANRTPIGLELGAIVHDAVSASTTALQQQTATTLAVMQNSVMNNAAPVLQPVQIVINTLVSQDKWSDEFTQKITWLASSNKDQTAELHLNPPQLGPLDVVIKVSGDQATALFTSPHAAVRDAIEQAMPKLRDMLADNGIMLGNATVSDQAPRDQGQPNAQLASNPSTNTIRDTTVASNSVTRVSQISRHNGIVDTFA
jgi:flagellar hook-length control protein FliK